MKEAFMLFIVALVPIILFGLVAWLMYSKVAGWGWFLLATLIFVCSVEYRYTANKGDTDSQSKSARACDEREEPR